MFPLPSTIFKTKSYQDIRGPPRHRAPYTNPTNAATISKLPHQPAVAAPSTFTSLPHVNEDSEPIERPDETITALPERQPKLKFSCYFQSSNHTPTTLSGKPPAAKVLTKRCKTTPTPSPDTKEVKSSFPPACIKAKWSAFFKSPFQGIKLGKENKNEAKRPRIQISAPYGFRHEASANWPQTVQYQSDGEEDEEEEEDEDEDYEDCEHDEDDEDYVEEEGEWEGEWEDIEEE